MTKKILITGCLGQIGTELTLRLSSEYGAENVLATDIRPAGEGITSYARFETLDVKNAEAVEKIIDENGITTRPQCSRQPQKNTHSRHGTST